MAECASGCSHGHGHGHGHSHSGASEDSWEDIEGENVKAANEIVDPLEAANSKRELVCKDGSIATVKFYKAAALTPQLLDWIMDLFTRNMKSMYRKSVWGWKPKEKKKELTEEEAKYLILFKKDKPVAFTHFRFDMDFGREVVYCYEIQIEEKVRGMGLGKFLMERLYEFATHFQLTDIVLTVFTFNIKAVNFFTNNGFTEDKTSPTKEEKVKYIIMSKAVPSQVA